MEAWEAAGALRAEGADIRAVTAWALFGLVDWDTLLLERNGRHEPGAFDVRHMPPQPTPLSRTITDLVRHGRCGHAALAEVGWWHKLSRIPGDYGKSSNRP